MKMSYCTWTSYLKTLSSWAFQLNLSSRPAFQTFTVLLCGLFLLQRLVDRYTSPWIVGIKFNFNVGVFASKTKTLYPLAFSLKHQHHITKAKSIHKENPLRWTLKPHIFGLEGPELQSTSLWILTSLGLATYGPHFLAPRCSSEFNLTFVTFVCSLGIYWPLTVCPALF